MARSGGCQCGEVRYACAGDPLALFVCHCRECREQSGSAFGMSLQVPRASLQVLRGRPQWWQRPTDSGRRLRCCFCPRCGTRLWHEPDPPGDTVTVKAGTLDAPVDYAGAIHIWTSRRLAGVTIPAGATQFPEGPA